VDGFASLVFDWEELTLLDVVDVDDFIEFWLELELFIINIY
jgi:hypothetical protein